MTKLVILTEISLVLVVNIVPRTPMKSARSRCLKMAPLFVAEDVFLRVNLDAPALVADVHEHGFAHVAVRGDAAGERDFAALGVILARVGAGFAGREFVFERVNALGAQGVKLFAALFDQ